MKTLGLLSKDLVAGLLFVAIGIAFLWIGLDYRFGTNRQMGPGYFPIVLSSLMILLGVIVALKGLFQGGERIGAPGLKGMTFVLGATFVFALLIRPAGMPIAIFVLTFAGSMASAKFRLLPSLLLAAGLAAFCVVVFNWALGMPFPIWGYWFR